MMSSASSVPAMLFFSGGTALRKTSAVLAGRGEPTIHLVTPFDSGGSTAELRRVFAMPAVGDIRARQLSLTAELPKAAVLNLRLPTESAGEAFATLESLINRTHPLLRAVSANWGRRVALLLKQIRTMLPPEFDPRWASVGNLVLAALYLRHDRSLNRASMFFGRLAGSRGIVRPVVDVDAQLSVRLGDGQIITGQHLFTGKQYPPIHSPIQEIRIVSSLTDETPLDVAITPDTRRIIRKAGLIVYPVGSFYSSIIANLLPAGVGSAVCQAACRKVFIPNSSTDPELCGQTLKQQITRLLSLVPVTHVLVDGRSPYPGGVPEKWLDQQGIRIVRRDIMDESGRLCDRETAAVLCELRADGTV